MTALTVQITDDTAARLDEIAGKLDRSRAGLVAGAIEEYLSREAWQIAEIEAGIADADRGDFAADTEVAAVLAKYLRPGAKA